MNSPQAPQTAEKGMRESFDDLRLVAKAIGISTAVASLFTAWYSIRLAGWSFALQIVWAVGLWCLAVAIGFLFAIPKVLQGPSAPPTPVPAVPGGGGAPTPAAPPPAPPGYSQRVNTNLEEISDWLTKIIVGVTLVELKQLPPPLYTLAD